MRHRLQVAAKRGISANSPPPPDGFKTAKVSTYRDGDGNVKGYWTQDRLDSGPSFDDIEAAVSRAFERFNGKSKLQPPPKDTLADLATIYPCPDWHIGQLSWGKETGSGNWDTDIARRAIGDAMSRVISTSPPSNTAVLLGLGDLLHFDGYEPFTARSKNVLDVDGRYPEVLETATELLLECINLALQKHETILVRILPGNHDDQSAISVTLALKMFFSNNKRVTVDSDPGRYWWWSWGDCFLGATHGDKAKMKQLPLVMATRNKKAFGNAKHCRIFTGHIHTETAIEDCGIPVESLQSPTAPDAYHAGMGYGAGRTVQSITFHKTKGLKGRVIEGIEHDNDPNT